MLRSSVIGFYSQSEGLSAVFRRDRFLQGHSGVDGSSWLGSTPAERLALLREIDNALSGSIALRDAYNDFLAVQSLITNPPALGTLNELSSATEESRIALFPHSRSLEEELFTGQVIANPMDFLRRSLLDGSAELKTTDDSGWYDYQQQALETLLLPERGSEFSKLALSPAYVARLEQAFEATITQRRETQSKNLMAGEVSAAPRLEERPALHLEPAPTLYLRTARAYRFLHDSLAGLPANAAGNEQLDWLLSESAAAMRRYYAMHCLSCADIGLPLGISPQELAGILPEEHEPAAADPLLLGSGVLLDQRFTEEERLIYLPQPGCITFT